MEHLIQGDCQSPSITLFRVKGPLICLRRHIGRRAYIECFHDFLSHEDLAIPEVNNFDLSFLTNHHISGLEIPMNHALARDRHSSFSQFLENSHGFHFFKFMLFHQVFFKCFSFTKFSDDEAKATVFYDIF